MNDIPKSLTVLSKEEIEVLCSPKPENYVGSPYANHMVDRGMFKVNWRPCAIRGEPHRTELGELAFNCYAPLADKDAEIARLRAHLKTAVELLMKCESYIHGQSHNTKPERPQFAYVLEDLENIIGQ